MDNMEGNVHRMGDFQHLRKKSDAAPTGSAEIISAEDLDAARRSKDVEKRIAAVAERTAAFKSEMSLGEAHAVALQIKDRFSTHEFINNEDFLSEFYRQRDILADEKKYPIEWLKTQIDHYSPDAKELNYQSQIYAVAVTLIQMMESTKPGNVS